MIEGHGGHGHEPSSHGAQQLERLTFFSDAVFAIAMTLLVIEIRLPHVEHWDDAVLTQTLLNLIPHYIGFIISFLVIGRFWVAHHRIFGLLEQTSPRLVWANLFLLMTVAFMPFPTAVVSELPVLRASVLFYAGWLTIMGLVHSRLVGVALSHKQVLARADLLDATRRHWLRGRWIAVLIGVIAMAGALVAAVAGILALMFASPLVSWALHRGKPAPTE